MPQGEKIPLGRSALLCIRKKLPITMNLKEIVDRRFCVRCCFASLTLFLASPRADYIHGANVPIDGGWVEK